MRTVKLYWLLLHLVGLVGCAPRQTPPEAAAPAPAEKTPAGPAELDVVSRALSRAGALTVRLSNGLTVIVAENHNVPVVCVRAYVRAGGLYEGKYLGCGISHLCEHLVAQGAEHDHGPGETVKVKRGPTREDKIGGQSNAYTSLAYTCYYIAATSGKTGDCIDLVADWMVRPAITRDDFQREHGVVQRELEMRRDSPNRHLWYAHARNFYGTHPAGVPVIGYQAPLSALRYEDVLDYHRRMYPPQNMALVVVGDVDAAKALDRVRRAFAGLPPGRMPELTLPDVPPVAGRRRLVTTHKAVTEAAEMLTFRTIPLVHEDLYALDVLSYILSNGESSRLVRTVRRRDRLVTSISSSSWTPAWGAGQFTINFRAAPDKADAAEDAIVAELRKVVADGVTAEELTRAKRQKVADFVYSQQTVQSQAATLGSDYLATGDVEFSRQYTDRIQKVTVDQVRAAGRKYFDFDRMVVTRMLPAGSKAAAVGKVEAAGKARTKTLKLPNGLRVILHSSPTVDLVSMTLATRGGLLLESPKTNGVGMLMSALSTKGAGKRSAEQIAAFFEGAGGAISGRCGNNTFYWRGTVLSDSFEEALSIFADVVLRPRYPAKELEIFRPMLLAGIRQTSEHWQGLLTKHWRSDFFGDSPLSMLPIGSAEVVKAASSESVAEYHRRNVRAGASVLAIYGRFDVEATADMVEKLFAAMPSGDSKTPDLPARKVAAEGERFLHASKLKTAGIIVAAPGMKVTETQDRLAVTVLDTIISGWRLPRGWLHDELRGRKLVYVVHAYNWPSLVPGAFMVSANCDPQRAGEVAGIIRKHLRRTLSHPFTQAEVDEAANFVLTAELLENQAMSSLSMQAALDELYGRGYDFRQRYERLLRAVTPEEVARVAKKYLGGGYVTTVVTPQPGMLSDQDE